MQTKSPLIRIAVLVGAALTIVALIFSVKALHRAHLSESPVTNHHTVSAATFGPPPPPAQKAQWTREYGKLPLAFEANHGQTAPEVHYLAHGQGYQLFLTSQEAVFAIQRQPAGDTQPAKGASLLLARRKPNAMLSASTLRMHFDGANPTVEISGTAPLPGRVNYFIGNDPRKWHTDIPSYEAVRYQGIYPGVDLLFYGRGQTLEYDFVVAPGTNPQVIALSIAGARKLKLDSQGNVVMSVTGGEVVLQKPLIYQETSGVRREIAGSYAIAHDRQIHFSVGAYDHTQPLTVDPLLNYSTYVGGENFDSAAGIALDAAGDAYIAGKTTSTAFPQVNPISGTAPSDLSEKTVFVSELNPTGTALLYSTYLGGSGNGSLGEAATAIAADTASPPNVYVTGFTFSPDFPVSTVLLPNQGQPGPAGTSSGGSAFITKLAPSASGSAQLAYSSYLGGDTSDEGFSIAVDGSGNAYIAGLTMSTNFPRKGTPITAGQTSTAGNAFLTVISTTASGGASLVYSTYLGGSGTGTGNFLPFGDIALGIAIDTASDAYVVGSTTSTDFPTVGTAIAGSAPCGATTNGSAFISVVNTTAQTLTYSHCLSGNNYEAAFGISLGTGVPAVATKIAYITGTTGSSNFPVTANSIPHAGTFANGVAFASLLNTATGTLQYSTYLGDTNGDVGFSIGSDSLGNAYVTGVTASPKFPITQGALELTLNNLTGEAFVSKISPNGNGLADLVYSSFFGGQTTNTLATPDEGFGIAVSGTNAYIAGQMASPDMPVSSGAFQTTLRSAAATANAFVADLPLIPTISVSPTSINFGTQLIGTPTAAQFVTLTNNTSSSVTLTLPPTFVGANASDFTATGTGGTCGASLAAGASCMVGVTFTPSSAGTRAVTMKIVDSLDTAAHFIQVALTGTGSATLAAINFSPTSLTFPGQLLTTTSTAQTVTITNPGTVNALNISAIAFSNADFGIASTSACGLTFPITIAPGGTACVVSVIFKPAAATTPGADTGTMMVTDNANGSPQSVPLTGTAWDFSVSAPNSVSVARGAMGNFPVTVTGLGGFTAAVSFTCTPGSALVTACAVPTTNAAAAPGAMATGTLTASSFVVAPESMKLPPPASLKPVLFVLLAIALLIMLPSTRRFRTRVGLNAAVLVFIVVAGCTGNRQKTTTTTLTITPSSGGVTKPAISVTVNITS
ncbi:MAG: choice-of-anchor D domain-containing protein [Candidatus Acidiferrales bacterium]